MSRQTLLGLILLAKRFNFQKFMIAPPTVESPLLVGLLVDVSGSMTSAIENKSGGSINRLESFQAALGDLAARAQQLSPPDAGERLYLFAYGFGFGNLLSSFLGGSGASVRDLLAGARSGGSTVPVSELAKNWSHFQQHVESQALHMFGATPMLEGFKVAAGRFDQEQNSRQLSGRILFVLSDGEPTDATPEEIGAAAKKLKDEGVLIVSCFVTNQDITSIRRLYGASQPGWPSGAALMHDAASPVPENSPLSAYLREHHWAADPGARLFTQVNQSQVLSEFLQMLVSPLQEIGSTSPPKNPMHLFVSYSHEDARWLDRLKVHLAPLVANKAIDLWDDKRIGVGDQWRGEIDRALSNATAAVLLVSPEFLASDFIQKVELPSLLRAAQKRNTRILPVIVAPCRYDLSPLAAFQAINDPKTPLSTMTKAKAEAVFVELSRAIG